jgi:serpin B
MASAGAVGDTKQELAEVFGLPAEPASHEAQNLLAATLEEIGIEDEETGETVVLDLANSVWGQSGMPFGEPFLDTLATHYGAGLRSIDFGEAEAARSAINGWVSDRTRDRIPDLLSPGFIKPGLTRLVLVNAVYLKATWAEQFATEATTSEAFLRLDGSTVEVPMMNGPAVAGRYATNDGYVAVEVPYSGNDLSMLLIVPDDFETVEQALSSSWLSGLDDQLAAGTIDLSMPRWEIETDLDLGPALTTLGFEIPGGDFSGIAPGLFIDEAIHAANITVDEQGTEAAAATAIGFLESAPLVDVTLRVDRPFLFVVRHHPTGTPLFIGRVTDPTSG